jgi:hypothetical protein
MDVRKSATYGWENSNEFDLQKGILKEIDRNAVYYEIRQRGLNFAQNKMYVNITYNLINRLAQKAWIYITRFCNFKQPFQLIYSHGLTMYGLQANSW